MQVSTASGPRSGIAHAIDEIDLGRLGRGLWQRKRLIIGLTLAATVVALIAVNLATPRYKSEARVLIETRDNVFLRPEADRTTERSATVDQEAMTSQVQLILSRRVAQNVIRDLKLGEKPEFDPVLRPPSTIRTVLGLVGLVRDPLSQTPQERVLRSYTERLVAFQVEKSRVIAIEFESQDPAVAADVANAVAEGYLVAQQAAKQEQTRAAGDWLASEIEKLRKSVAEAEARVERYRADTFLMIGSNNTTLSTQQLGDFNAQLAAARAQKAEAESKSRLIREALRRPGAAADFSDIMNSELLRRLAEQHVTLRAQLAEQSSTLLSRHPRIRELTAQIADLERQMRAEGERLARAFENDAKLASARVEALQASLDQLKKQAASSNQQDVQLRAMERDARVQRELLESYLVKYREATARDSISAASPDARIISRAVVSSTPSWPKKLPTVLVAALGMFTLAAGFVLTGQLMNGGVMVVRMSDAPAPAATVQPLLAPERVAAAAPAVAAPPVTAEPMPGMTEPAEATGERRGPSAAAASPSGGAAALARMRLALGDTVPPLANRHAVDAAIAVEAGPGPVAAAGAGESHAPSRDLALDRVADEAPAAAAAAAGYAQASVAPPAPMALPPEGAPPTQPAPIGETDTIPRSAAGVPIEAVEGLALALGNVGESGRQIAVVGARRHMGTTTAAVALARALARQGRVILIDLALQSPDLAAIASDPSVPGLGELVAGSASFGDVISRDRYSRVHLITAGQPHADADAILSSQRLAITLEALGRTYDYVILDAGALPEISPETFAQLAPRAVLVADDIDGPETEFARDRLLSAGFPNVSVLASSPQGPESDTARARVAA